VRVKHRLARRAVQAERRVGDVLPVLARVRVRVRVRVEAEVRDRVRVMARVMVRVRVRVRVWVRIRLRCRQPWSKLCGTVLTLTQ